MRSELVTARFVTGDDNGRDDIDVQQTVSDGLLEDSKNIGSIDVEIGVEVKDMGMNLESKNECFVVRCTV